MEYSTLQEVRRIRSQEVEEFPIYILCKIKLAIVLYG